jgi:uncharacterized protein (DUF849 family)
MAEKVVITAALAGGATFKKHNPNVPYTAEEFVEEAMKCWKSGAAVVHIHARDTETEMPTTEEKFMRPIVEGIREKTDLLINLSTGVHIDSSKEERARPIKDYDPDMASLNPGTMNFCFYDYKRDEFLMDGTFENPFSMTIEFAKIMREKKIKPELECFDVGHIANTLFLFDRGLLDDPGHYTFVFGVMGGIQFNLDNLICMMSNIPPGNTWQGLGVGRDCFPVAMAGAMAGGHIRVGLEDNIYIDYAKREKAKGSWDQVEKAVKIAQMANREPASPAEAREILNIPKR